MPLLHKEPKLKNDVTEVPLTAPVQCMLLTALLFAQRLRAVLRSIPMKIRDEIRFSRQQRHRRTAGLDQVNRIQACPKRLFYACVARQR